jgi:Pyruvate/2-oxoacid:ferredoxin oxidoreductase delta subunit
MTVFYCHCGYEKVCSSDAQRAVLDEILRRGVEFLAGADLCGLCTTWPGLMKTLLGSGSVVIGCHARAMRWLLRWAGVDPRDVAFVDVRGPSAADAVAELSVALAATTEPQGVCPAGDADLLEAGVIRVPPGRAGDVTESLDLLASSSLTDKADWLPWFPVIDFDRCTSCGQCRNFCLFGVYSQENGAVKVAQPAKCKPHCPACSRVCPACAIMFPKHNQAPADGTEVRPEHLAGQLKPEEIRKRPPADLLETLRKKSQIPNPKSQTNDKQQ